MPGNYTFTRGKQTAIGTAPVDVYTNNNALASVPIGFVVSNILATEVTVDIVWAGAQMLKGATIPPGGGLDVIAQIGKIPLLNLEKVTVTCNTAAGVDCLVGVMEET